MRFFHELSMQEMFEKAYAGLEAQAFQQSRLKNDHTCAYRAPDGKRCAVGHLIDDEDYSAAFEGRPIGDLLVGFSESDETKSALTKMEFLRDMQRAHDFATARSGVRGRMMAVARRYALDVPDEAA